MQCVESPVVDKTKHEELDNSLWGRSRNLYRQQHILYYFILLQLHYPSHEGPAMDKTKPRDLDNYSWRQKWNSPQIVPYTLLL